MCNWTDKEIPYASGNRRIKLPQRVFRDACRIIKESRNTLTYAEVMGSLKNLGNQKVSRLTIGMICGEVTKQVAESTNPSIYPSAIVCRKGTDQPSEDFWGLNCGDNPPIQIAENQRQSMLRKYQDDVFNGQWSY